MHGGNPARPSQIDEARAQLDADLDQLRAESELKDTEIRRLKQEIADLQTMVQIESLKSELANLKSLASKSL